MTKKRYFERKWEGEYYIFDSYTINCLNDIAGRLNELAEENRKLKEGIYPVDIDIITKKCENCKHWNCDTGFCKVKMIITSRNEICEFWGLEDD